MSKFKIYSFSFKGMFLGGNVIVVSVSEGQARKHARKRIDDMGFPEKEMHLDEICEIKEGSIPYEYNGDY